MHEDFEQQVPFNQWIEEYIRGLEELPGEPMEKVHRVAEKLAEEIRKDHLQKRAETAYSEQGKVVLTSDMSRAERREIFDKGVRGKGE